MKSDPTLPDAELIGERQTYVRLWPDGNAANMVALLLESSRTSGLTPDMPTTSSTAPALFASAHPVLRSEGIQAKSVPDANDQEALSIGATQTVSDELAVAHESDAAQASLVTH